MLKVHRFFLNNSLRNYNYFLQDQKSNYCIALDPTDADTSVNLCQQHNLTPQAIWLTHNDHDHISGAQILSDFFQIPIFCSRSLKKQFTQAYSFQHGEILSLGEIDFEVWFTPGHTDDHHCFVEHRSQSHVFCGDVCFNFGAGRVRDAQYAKMLDSLTQLKSLNGNCIIHNAHDYDLTNLKFSLSLLGKNAQLTKKQQQLEKFTANSRPASTIKEQQALNLFFNCQRPDIVQAIKARGLSQFDELSVFTALRQCRDQW